MSPRIGTVERRSRESGWTLRTELLTAARLPALLQSDALLAVYSFTGRHGIDDRDPRQVSIGLEQLGGTRLVEAWWASGQVTGGAHGRIRYAADEEVLCGHLCHEEDSGQDLTALVEDVYSEILDFVAGSGYSNLFRCWNYLSHINRIDRGLERYRAFCVGRHAAFRRRAGFERRLPAASAIGAGGDGLLISFAASRTGVRHIENPRQLSAFRYPVKHGPRSPLFSRGVSVDRDNGQCVYLSGTASILGHESVHRGDLEAQTTETLRNIGAVLDRAGLQRGVAVEPGLTEGACLRVYLRHADDYPRAQALLASQLGPRPSVVYLQGDICRSELLIEIEGGFCHR